MVGVSTQAESLLIILSTRPRVTDTGGEKKLIDLPSTIDGSLKASGALKHRRIADVAIVSLWLKVLTSRLGPLTTLNAWEWEEEKEKKWQHSTGYFLFFLAF